MSWIQVIPPAEAEGQLEVLYGRVAGPGGEVDNILQVHGLRPHTLMGHMAIYKNVLHHSDNTLPLWLREAIGVFVSGLNACQYCVDHHATGLQRALGDSRRAEALLAAFRRDAPEEVLEGAELAAIRYAARLTLAPDAVRQDDIAALRAAGLSDGEILEVNQVTAYFAYANRVVLGLGVTTEGDVLGLAPSGDDDAWGHR